MGAFVRADALVGGKRLTKTSSAELAQATKGVLAKRKAGAGASASKVAKAKGDLAREKWLAKHLTGLGVKPTRVTSKGGRMLVEFDAAVIEAIRFERWRRRAP